MLQLCSTEGGVAVTLEPLYGIHMCRRMRKEERVQEAGGMGKVGGRGREGERKRGSGQT